MRDRGIVAANAMARPRRPVEADALIARGLAGLPAELSLRSRARLLARRVVAELVADSMRDDPLELALTRARLALGEDPALLLATCPALDLAADLATERVRRFAARSCRQLSAHEWEAETQDIAGMLEVRFAERFRRCKKMGGN